jgi:DNA modification methylase
MRTLEPNSVDSIVTDPPYELKFMGKGWDGTGIANDAAMWAEALRVLKPGGHLLAFSGSRTYHRMVCAIEDAGFEIRDQIMWVYGAGFPKSHNISKVLGDTKCGCCNGTETLSQRDVRPVQRTDVSAALNVGAECSEILLAGVPEQGSHGAVLRAEPEEGRARSAQFILEGRGDVPQEAGELRQRPLCEVPAGTNLNGQGGRLCDGTSAGNGEADRQAALESGVCASSRPQAAEQRAIELGTLAGQPQPQERGAWAHCERCGKPIIPDGLGTALKPAHEPVVVARKPLSESTVAANVLKWGTGAINVGACRVPMSASDAETIANMGGFGRANYVGAKGIALSGSVDGSLNKKDRDAQAHPAGRWPANLLHDCSDEVTAAFPETTSGSHKPYVQNVKGWKNSCDVNTFENEGDSGSAARFFYTAKADADDRLGSKHPTVKPVDLMQYLIRLVTPKGGLVLDCFAGSGSTGEAAFREGCRAILIEREPEYLKDIERRCSLILSGSESRRRESIKARGKAEYDAGPLFGAAQ